MAERVVHIKTGAGGAFSMGRENGMTTSWELGCSLQAMVVVVVRVMGLAWRVVQAVRARLSCGNTNRRPTWLITQ